MASHYVGPLSTLHPYAAWPDVGVACVWLPQLALRAEILRHPDWDGRPVVMGGGPGDLKTVQLCSPKAERAGIRPGLPLREVVPLCREAIVVQPDPVRMATVLEEVLSLLQRVGPAVELGQQDGGFTRGHPSSTKATPPWLRDSRLFMDLRGMSQAYGGTLAALERAMRAVVPGLLRPSIGFGSGKFAAWTAARLAPERGYRVVPAEDTVDFLAPLSVAYLPFTPDVQERLTLLGIRTIGQLGALPFSAVQAQFGRQGARSWRLAHGDDDEPILAQPYVPIVRVMLRCDDPISSIDAFMVAFDQVLTHAFANPSMRNGCSARQLRLRALLSDGSSWERSFTFKEALSGKAAIRQAMRNKLKAASMLPAAPIEELGVELLGLGPETARQLPLFGSRVRQQKQLADGVRQLAARYSHSPLFLPVEVEPWSRIPERRWALTPFEP